MEWVKQYALYIVIAAGFIVGALCMWLLSPLLNQNNTVEVENEWLLDDKGFEEGGKYLKKKKRIIQMMMLWLTLKEKSKTLASMN